MKTYKFKLYHAKRNKHLHKAINIHCYIYNHCIALYRRYYRLFGKHLNAIRLKNHITKLKKQKRFVFWNTVGSQSIQDIVERIDQSYNRFFDSRKGHPRAGKPKFRKLKN